MQIDTATLIASENSIENPSGIYSQVKITRRIHHDSFAKTFEKYYQKICKYIQFRVGDEKTAEDLASQVFMKAWERIDQFQPMDAQFSTWLYTIAHNSIIDYYRTHKETVTLETSNTLPSEGMSPEEESETHFETEWLHEAISKLTEEQQHVVIMKYLRGLSTEEIAVQMGKRVGTVRALQMRALQSLSKQMVDSV